MVRAECDVAPVQNTTRSGQATEAVTCSQSCCISACSGEKGRAPAAARNAPPVPEQIVQEIKSLHPADPEPPAPVQAPVSSLFLSEVAQHIPTTLRKMPRLSEPGPLGMRAEHWYDFGSLVGNSDVFMQVAAHIAAAAIPHTVPQYLKAGQITPLAKTHRWPQTASHDVSFLRRLALQSAMAAERESVAKCAGPLQYGVGRPDGANTMIKNHPIPRGSIHLPSPRLLSTSKRPSKMCLAEPCCTVSRRPMRTLQLFSPSGVPAPLRTGCTTILPTPRFLPTAGWI